MDPFEILGQEHAVISRMVGVLSALVSTAEGGGEPNRKDVADCVRFFREFVDLNHHEKEESILFPALTYAGFDWNSEPLARVRREHDLERYLMRSLRQTALEDDAWSADDLRHFSSVGREFVALQEHHLAHERDTVFPAARETLGREQAQQVLDDFAELDAGQPDRSALKEIADRLVARYLH